MIGTVVHTELAADDVPALAEFYRDVFGWRITASTYAGGAYYVWEAGEDSGRQAGGIRQFRGDESREPSTRVTLYLAVADISEALSRIESAGGRTLMGKLDISPHGFIGVFNDPAGNTVGLWSAA